MRIISMLLPIISPAYFVSCWGTETTRLLLKLFGKIERRHKKSDSIAISEHLEKLTLGNPLPCLNFISKINTYLYRNGPVLKKEKGIVNFQRVKLKDVLKESFLFDIPTFFKYTAPACPHCIRWACVVSVLSRKEQELSPAIKLALLQCLSRAQRREQETEDIAVLTERGFGSNRRQFSLVVNSVWRYSWAAFVIDIIARIEIHFPIQSFCW